MTESDKVYRLSEVAEHVSATDIWIVIDKHVYNVTTFLDEHPGGEQTLMDVAGQDATASFEDVGHSSDAREMLKQYRIGVLHPDDVKKGGMSSFMSQSTCSLSTLRMLIPLVALAGVAVAFRYYVP